MKSPLIFIGLKGSGKTSAGKYLTSYFSCNWKDSDLRMQKKFHNKFCVKELFLLLGEPKFRQVEEKAIFSILNADVITLGGGSTCISNVQKYLQKQSHIVYLKAPFSYYQSLEREKFLHYPKEEKGAFAFYTKRCKIYESLAHKVIDVSQTDRQIKKQIIQVYNEWK